MVLVTSLFKRKLKKLQILTWCKSSILLAFCVGLHYAGDVRNCSGLIEIAADPAGLRFLFY